LKDILYGDITRVLVPLLQNSLQGAFFHPTLRAGNQLLIEVYSLNLRDTD